MNKKILFFCPLPPPIGGQSFISQLVFKQINPTYVINTNVKNKHIDIILVFIKTIYYLLFFNIDIVYFTCTRSKMGSLKDILLLTLCKLRNIKVINHLHGNELSDLFTNKFFAKIILWSYTKIDVTIFVTERQKTIWPKSLKNVKKVVIPNCYDPILDDITPNSKEINKNEIHILFISFLMKSKGILVALESFRKIAQEFDNVFFHVAGEPRSDYLMNSIEISKIFKTKYEHLQIQFPNRFYFHSVVKGNEKKNLFIKSDILLFPTFFKTESFGLVNVEAMRSGCVVITTNHNFLSDIVSKKEGSLIVPNDVESAYEALRYYIKNPEILREIQSHNIQHAELLYSPNRFKNNIMQLFNEIIKN